MFKVADLMIDVVSGPALEELKKHVGEWCLYPTPRCWLTPDWCRWLTPGCLITPDGCGPAWSTCFAGSELFLIDIKSLVVNPADIEVVRKEMDKLLTTVETRSAEIGQATQIRTVEQAEFLEVQLGAALKEVQEMKKRLG